MRVLGRTRISRSVEESTSIQRQRELIERWAKDNGHTVVAWAEDVDVSGSVSPFDAPEFGRYLREPLSHSWDIVVAWKLDRLARNSIAMHKLFAWVLENDKTLVCVSENIDLSTWVGRMIASVIAGVAEGELEAIKERQTASQAKLRELGRWHGGRPPYGYVPHKTDTGWTLIKDPEEQEILQEIFKRALEGEAPAAIAKQLNKEQKPTRTAAQGGESPRGWVGEVVIRMLRNPAYLGWTTHESKPIMDPTGKPVMKGPPSISIEDFNKIQGILGERRHRPAPGKTSPLLGVLVCWECGGNLSIRRAKKPNGRINESYYCRKECLKHSINGPEILGIVYSGFEQVFGDHKVLEKHVDYASDTTVELAEANKAYEELSNYIASAPNQSARDALFKQLNTLAERIKRLEAVPEEDTVRWVPTGETYREKWEHLDTEGKRQMMIQAGVKVRARGLTKGDRYHPGLIETEFLVPEDLREKLGLSQEELES